MIVAQTGTQFRLLVKQANRPKCADKIFPVCVNKGSISKDSPDQRLVQRHQGGVNGDGDHRQVEVIKHDGQMMVKAVVWMKVKTQSPAANQRHRGDICQPKANNIYIRNI